MRKKARRDHVLHKLVDLAELHIRGLCGKLPHAGELLCLDQQLFHAAERAVAEDFELLTRNIGIHADGDGRFQIEMRAKAA